MRNREYSLITLPPVPREGQRVLLCAVEEVLGRGTALGRHLTRAIASEDPKDLMQAQSAFDALSAELRQTIAEQVRTRMETEEEGVLEGALADNIVPLRPRSPGSPR